MERCLLKEHNSDAIGINENAYQALIFASKRLSDVFYCWSSQLV